MNASASLKHLTRIGVSLVAGFGMATLAYSTGAIAQTTNADPLQDLRVQDGSSDPFSTNGGTSAIFDMFHRARLGNNRDMREYLLEQRQNLNDEASQFRRRQLELLQTPAQVVPVEVAPTEN
ncbi:hypothetical protein QPK87_12605 [Kamptonema cortianum]|uniref:Uncharacterized protein n=1 Tax=Geitlerinema calcuttense NRMC-F 0142 TaxID=2922238 RepID=A0ABT7LYD8_9CYAN|nr:hypothetical protein [Geitlerinema calcuttense]MCD8487488.1 hypothetical protein [Desertifilum sp.]MDI9640239.1 hypothetical protein [Geitlerinema splendidum]MDK3157408.1 hypothetical protein [Kamptonema cortianum]MDL5057025.1 hypothetical protein [Geitlerinema calcuttense NRMC-F 0142]